MQNNPRYLNPHYLNPRYLNPRYLNPRLYPINSKESEYTTWPSFTTRLAMKSKPCELNAPGPPSL
jgi:hypothetical protein